MNAFTLRGVVFGVLIALFILLLGLLGYGNFRSGMPLPIVLLNTLILSIPLVVLCFCIGLIVEAWQQHHAGGLSARIAKFLFYTPRIAGILVILFLALFALDAFDTPGSAWVKIGAFLIHAAPSIILLVLLVLAWRWEWVGALIFGLAAALILIVSVIPRSIYSLGNILLFVLPMAVVAVLFWLDWRWRADLRRGRATPLR